MLSKNAIFTFPIFLLMAGGVFLMTPASAWAATVYVEEDGDDSNDGSADHPFETLEKAAEEVNEGDADEVKIGKGSFPGGVTFEESVSVEGEGKGSTTITGSLIFKKKAALKDVSVKTKAHNAITLGKNADATFEDIDVRDFLGTGIWMSAGNAFLNLKDSRIGGSSGKGIYAEAGSKLNLSGNSIVNNKQEGIDIRQNTRGTIKNNTISDNSESGMELIVGSSDFVISGNTIKSNGASGIAYQFYELKKKLGTITATGNTISGHRKYGVDCNKPQGGESPAGYWADSITLEENTLANNKMGDVSTKCKLIEAKTEEEEAKLEQQVAEEEKKEEMPVQPVADPAEQERINQENQAVEGVVAVLEAVINEARYQELQNQLARRHKAEILWHGYQGEELEALRQELESDTNELLSYQSQLSAMEIYKNRSDLQARVALQEEKLVQYQSVFTQYEQKKSVQSHLSLNVITRVNKLLYVLIF